MMKRPLIIGSRGSPLALYQARLVQNLLTAEAGLSAGAADRAFPVKTYTTSGDKLKGELAEFGGKGLFTKELEDRLDEGEIDLAVHSMKDVPTSLRDDHVITAILKREDPRDVFISPKYETLEALPKGALIGTASLRRRAQLSALRPDIRFCLIRGNVGTRLDKLQAGQCDGTFLALAGLKRLGQENAATQIISAQQMLGAPAQGAIGIEVRADNAQAVKAAGALNHAATQICVSAERAFLAGLDGSCRVPIAALATIKDGKLYMEGQLFSADGQQCHKASGFAHQASLAHAKKLGRDMSAHIREQGGR